MPALRLDRDGGHHRMEALRHAFWAACGSIVVLSIIVGIVGGVEPSEAIEITAVVLVLALLWLAHEWRLQWRVERGRRA
jgi:hypothetical protein